MIVLFSVVQRVAWYERSRPDCFFFYLEPRGLWFPFFSLLFSFFLPESSLFEPRFATTRNALLLNHPHSVHV